MCKNAACVHSPTAENAPVKCQTTPIFDDDVNYDLNDDLENNLDNDHEQSPNASYHHDGPTGMALST